MRRKDSFCPRFHKVESGRSRGRQGETSCDRRPGVKSGPGRLSRVYD